MQIEVDIPEPEFGDAMEIAMLSRLRDDGPQLVQQYIAKRTRDGVTYVSRDAAKRVFPEYLEDPTLNNQSADRAASALADAVRRTILSYPVRFSRDIVLLITGSPASGKTAASIMASAPRLEMIHETIITHLPKAITTIEQTLNAGRRPILHLFYTNDPRINVRRMIERARKIGRTVPVKYMSKAYVEVPRFVGELAETFAGRLSVRVTNNSWSPDNPLNHHDVARAVADVGAYTEEECLRCMDDELDQIHRSNPIPDSILRESRRR